eukprot:c13155_g1_i1 orf=2-229(-)
MDSSIRLGFIGAGQMAEAIASGLNRAGVVPHSRMCVADISSTRRQVFADLGALACDSNIQVVESSDVLLLAVKPQI